MPAVVLQALCRIRYESDILPMNSKPGMIYGFIRAGLGLPKLESLEMLL
jgi:hypothetical protein